MEKIIEAAATENVNILCLPEMWCELGGILSGKKIRFLKNLSDMPYPFYTPDTFAWKEFAEDCTTGASSNFVKKVQIKSKNGMVC